MQRGRRIVAADTISQMHCIIENFVNVLQDSTDSSLRLTLPDSEFFLGPVGQCSLGVPFSVLSVAVIPFDDYALLKVCKQRHDGWRLLQSV